MISSISHFNLTSTRNSITASWLSYSPILRLIPTLMVMLYPGAFRRQVPAFFDQYHSFSSILTATISIIHAHSCISSQARNYGTNNQYLLSGRIQSSPNSFFNHYQFLAVFSSHDPTIPANYSKKPHFFNLNLQQFRCSNPNLPLLRSESFV